MFIKKAAVKEIVKMNFYSLKEIKTMKAYSLLLIMGLFISAWMISISGCKYDVAEPTWDKPYDNPPTPQITQIDPTQRAAAGINTITFTGVNFLDVPSDGVQFVDLITGIKVRPEIIEKSETSIKIRRPNLASDSYDQGRYAATHIAFGKCEQQLVEFIPTGIYTIPEISSVGSTEEELTKDKIPYEVGHSFFRHLARAQITGRTTGMLKILFHRESLKILGVHCFGHGATEIIHIGQAIISQKGKANTLMFFINTTFNYPTMAEAYRVAALNGINKVYKLKKNNY